MRKLKDLALNFSLEKTDAYKHHIHSFIYFIEQRGINEQNLIPYLQGIRSKDVIEALEFYIRKNKITARDTAFGYSSAIKEFLYYSIESGTIRNSELKSELLSPGYDENSYRFKMNNFILNNELLKNHGGFEKLNSKDIEDIIDQCNQLLREVDKINKSKESKLAFHRIRSAIIIKLILLTGAPYREIRKICFNNIKIESGTVSISDFTLKIPVSFISDLKNYLQVVRSINPNNENVFIEFNGVQMSIKTANTASFLGNIIGRKDLSSLVRYSVKEMIRNGTSETIIRQLHGLKRSNGIIEECHSIVYSEQSTANLHLNEKIQQSELYCLL